MKVKCFDCDQVLEADGPDAVAEAFLAHARDRHAWPYPEEALRNYARNYGEATERVAGETERRPEIGEVVVHPVTEDRIDDWLRFFDRDAFADNPGSASCYCLEPHAPPLPDMPERPWRETRALMLDLLRRGASYGYLAYVDGAPAGWVNASLRSDYRIYGEVEPGGPDPRTVVGVSCFVVAPPFRRHGVASALLDRVVADAAARGASWVEAYPFHTPRTSDASHFRGPRAMYEARGFEPVERRERETVMRRPAA